MVSALVGGAALSLGNDVILEKVPHKSVMFAQKVPHKSVRFTSKVPHKNVILMINLLSFFSMVALSIVLTQFSLSLFSVTKAL